MMLEIILGLIVLTLGWTTFNLTRKVERLETWIENYAQRIQDTKQLLDQVDRTGHFESDDEVGSVFKTIKEAMDDLNKITETEI